MSVTKVRTPADRARLLLFQWSKRLKDSGREYPPKEAAIAGNASFAAVLVHATAADIAAIADEDALFIEEHDSETFGHLSGDFLVGVLGWDPEDIFFSSPEQAEAQAQAQAATGAPKGRRPSGWWPIAAGALAAMIHEEGPRGSQAEQEGRLLQVLMDEGHDVSPSSIRPAIQYLFAKLRMQE